MNTVKYALMVREFPFLAQILTENSLLAESIESIEVCQGDQNILEVTPSVDSHDAGQWGDYYKSREFWLVTERGEIESLETGCWRTQVPHGTKNCQLASSIGVQLMSAKRDVAGLQDVKYIVEVDCEDANDNNGIVKNVRVYKMQSFNWLSYCRHFVVKADKL